MKRQPAQCGTPSGYWKHLRQTHTPPCDACRNARNLASTATKRGGKPPRSVRIPSVLLAELYLSAPIEVQERVESELSLYVMDEVVRAYDEHNTINEKD